MAAVFALDPGKAVEEIAAIQIPLHTPFDLVRKKPYILSKRSSVT